MRRLGIALIASVALAGCVQTQQYADVEFAPPQGDYKLLVMRPDVAVGSVTTGGLVEPRADWTETARAKLLAALRAQQAGRGGNVLILDRRDSAARSRCRHGRRARAASLCGRQLDRASQIFGRLPADQARQGPRLDAWRGCRRARPAHRLWIMRCSSTPRTASPRPAGWRLQVLGVAGCLVGFCAPNIGGAGQFAYACLVDLRTGEVVWFNVLQTGSQVAGIKMGDIRTERAPRRWSSGCSTG